MSVQRITKSFRNFNISSGQVTNNLQDSYISPGVYWPNWSTGAAIVDQVAIGGPGPSQHWSVIAVAVQASVVINLPNNQTYFGKLGKLIAALILDPQTIGLTGTGGAGGAPYISLNPAIQFPYDTTLVGTMWDPATDSLPPTGLALATQLNGIQNFPVSTVIEPTNPIELHAGVQPNIGMWLEPALIGSSQVNGVQMAIMSVFNGSYTVVFDDGE